MITAGTNLKTGTGRDPARDFAVYRFRNLALLHICEILQECGILLDYPADFFPQKFLKVTPACRIPQNILYLAGILENGRFWPPWPTKLKKMILKYNLGRRSCCTWVCTMSCSTIVQPFVNSVNLAPILNY